MFSCPNCNYQNKKINSLRIHAQKSHGISSEDLYLAVVVKGPQPTCACGCGEQTRFLGLVKGYSTYKRGHVARINNNWGHNKEAQKKSQETRSRMWKEGELQMWNKGLTKDDPRIQAGIEKMNTPERAQKISAALKGQPKSEQHKNKIGKFMKEYWSKEENRERQSKRQAACIMNGMLTYATREHGYFKCSTKSKKPIAYYRSLFELNALNYLEAHNQIVKYQIEPFRVSYEYEEKTRYYVVDFWIQTTKGEFIIEIKPSCHVSHPKNNAKFSAAKKFAEEKGWSFEIWTEKTHPFLADPC